MYYYFNRSEKSYRFEKRIFQSMVALGVTSGPLKNLSGGNSRQHWNRFYYCDASTSGNADTN